MSYAQKPLPCDPTRIRGMSEKLIRSHYENNYGGTVNRLNAIAAQLATLDFATAPGFVSNALKRARHYRQFVADLVVRFGQCCSPGGAGSECLKWGACTVVATAGDERPVVGRTQWS